MSTLSRLQVWDFRNIQHLDVILNPGMTLLLGANGQGKSNVLEALCYLGLLRSFRTQGVAEMRRWGQASFTIHGEINDLDASKRASLAVSQGEKRYLQVNGSTVEKGSEFINRFVCIPFVPEDLDMAKGPAASRRRFLDMTISQRWPSYLPELQKYREAVGSRNMALRAPAQYPEPVVSSYEELIVRHGGRIENLRRRYVEELHQQLADLSADLMGVGAAGLSLTYSCPGIQRDRGVGAAEEFAEMIRQALYRNRERDRREAHTSVGPHRADMTIALAGRPLAAYGSEGECRMACLILRLASLAMTRQGGPSDRAVVALIDDVVGELDSSRRGAFYEAVRRADQVLVTATERPPELVGLVGATYSVKAGTVLPL